jgi:hypothetical protein
MLTSYLDAIERVLLAHSEVAQKAGHPNLRGGPREWFVREFLEQHLPTTLEIGQGEIVNSSSEPSPAPNAYRPQVDVVLYRRDFPRLAYSRQDFGYLIEGSLATVECKSVLTKAELLKACRAQQRHKKLGYQYMEVRVEPKYHSILPYPLSYVIAYNCGTQINTAAGWLQEIGETLSADADQLVDVIVVLGKGVIWRLGAYPTIDVAPSYLGHRWAVVAQETQNLAFMFAHMLMWVPASSRLPGLDYHKPYLNLSGACKTL